MFGKLSLSAIPYHDPIVMGAVVGSLLAGFGVIVLLTYFKKWTYLWKEWLISFDHKKIGIMIPAALMKQLRFFLRMGPIVCELEGPGPILKRSKRLKSIAVKRASFRLGVGTGRFFFVV